MSAIEGIPGATTEGGQRIDRWLWASRFYKTRPLARAAVNAGRVEVNGGRAKPAKSVRVGDRVVVHGSGMTWEVVVQGLNAQRRPAREAAALYEETAESAAARAAPPSGSASGSPRRTESAWPGGSALGAVGWHGMLRRVRAAPMMQTGTSSRSRYNDRRGSVPDEAHYRHYQAL